MYLHRGICAHVYMYRCTCGIFKNALESYRFLWNAQTRSVRVLLSDNVRMYHIYIYIHVYMLCAVFSLCYVRS